MKIKYILTILTCVTLLGCKKFLQIDPPKTEQVPGSIFNNSETANSAMLTIFGKMSSLTSVTAYDLSFLTGIAGDELVNNLSTAQDIYINAIDPKNSETNGFWSDAYTVIYAANQVYESAGKSSAISSNLKNQLTAEAAFLRAYWYFYLVNLYGAVPLIISTDYSASATANRQPAAKVYEQIITDLKYAQENLNASYVGPDGVSPVTERIRPSKAVATALLSRVYLYTNKYKDAENLSTSLISASTNYNLEPLDKVFLKESKEAIWQIMALNGSSFNTEEGNLYIPTTVPSTESKPTISDQLFSSFENGDNRKSNWIGTFTDTEPDPDKNYYYPFKYKVQTGSDQQEYAVIFRLAEQYLIRSEARTNLNDLAGAISDIDMIRDRAGLPLLKNTNPDISKEGILSAILKERRVELFVEQGHRWLDLKRTKSIDAVMAPATALKGGIWSDNKQLWPIPYSELLKAKNLTQNPGYE
jgi:starch-binding outer membrane protein, SusD/RagB family